MTTLKAGDKAPEFRAADQSGTMHSLGDYRGRKLVIFFYPGADTPSCTREACNLRDNYQELISQNYALLGVSPDTAKKQEKFRVKYKLPFPLLADIDHAVINAFGVWGPKKFMGRLFDGLHRTTFVIDEQGVIEKVIEKVVTKSHAAQIVATDA